MAERTWKIQPYVMEQIEKANDTGKFKPIRYGGDADVEIVWKTGQFPMVELSFETGAGYRGKAVVDSQELMAYLRLV